MNREYPMSKGLWTSSALGVAAYADEIKLFIDIYNNYFENIMYLLTTFLPIMFLLSAAIIAQL